MHDNINNNHVCLRHIAISNHDGEKRMIEAAIEHEEKAGRKS